MRLIRRMLRLNAARQRRPGCDLHIRTSRAHDKSRLLKVKHLEGLVIPGFVKHSIPSYDEPLNAVRTAFDFSGRESGVIFSGVRLFEKCDIVIALVVTAETAKLVGR